MIVVLRSGSVREALGYDSGVALAAFVVDLAHFEPMTPKQQLFVDAYIANGFNATQAAITIGYNDNKKTAEITGSRYWGNVEVRRAVFDHVENTSVAVRMDHQAVLQKWVDIATADPNELMHHRVRCCRHCYGINGAYQWKSTEEWAEALERAVKAHEDDCAEACRRGKEPPLLRLPSDEGGFDFNPRLQPIVECEQCDGDGITQVIVADTRLLKGKARALFKGIKKTKDGIEVLMHDQLKATEYVARHLGMLNDKLQITMPGGGALHSVDQLRETLSDEELEQMENVIMRIDAKTELLEAVKA